MLAPPNAAPPLAPPVPPVSPPQGADAGPPGQIALPGGPAPPLTEKWHDVTVVRKKTVAQARVMGVPPEEFGIERNARSLTDCGYCFHEIIKREADAIADGFDEQQIKGLPSYTLMTGVERLARDTVNESVGTGGGDDGLNSANRMIRITEHYVRMDYEGDGIARLYKVSTGGEMGIILEKNKKPDICEMDAIPFVAMTPVIVTHRFFGRSIADLVMDIQRIKTALLRGMLDNVYLAVNARPIVSENEASEATLDDLLISRPGAPIRAKTATAVQWQQVPDIVPSVLPVIQFMDSTREWRTGVTRQGQGIDPNALQNQVATIANQAYTASQAKMKLIARIFAETGIKDLFLLLHRTIRRHGQQTETVKLRNTWVEVNPRDWKERNDMTVTVGLSSGGKTEQLAHLTTVVGMQKDALINGLTNLVTIKNLYNSACQITKLLGLKDPDEFWTDPDSQPPLQAKPDPKLVELQMKGQLEQEKSQADTQHQIAKNQADAALAQKKFELEAQLKMIDAQLKEKEHNMKVQEHVVKLAGQVGQRDATTGQPTGPSLQDVQTIMSAMHPPQRGMMVVRHPPGHPDAGKISHIQPA